MGITSTQVRLNYAVGQTPGNTTVTTVSTEIIAVNTDRRWAFLVNNGNKDVWIAFGQTAVVDSGVLLPSNGGQLNLTLQLNTIEAINGITQAATSIVAFQEGQ